MGNRESQTIHSLFSTAADTTLHGPASRRVVCQKNIDNKGRDEAEIENDHLIDQWIYIFLTNSFYDILIVPLPNIIRHSNIFISITHIYINNNDREVIIQNGKAFKWSQIATAVVESV